MYDLGIVIPAVGIEPAVVQRLVDSIKEHENTCCSYKVEIVTECGDAGSGASLNVSRVRNCGIKRCLEDCRVICCMDADYIVPAGLLDYMACETGDSHLWVIRRDLPADQAAGRRWAHWACLPIHGLKPDKPYGTCSGSCNAMSPENWLKVGGWDERCIGWGGEDDLLHIRIVAAGIQHVAVCQFPLMHVNHPPRSFCSPKDKRFSKRNMTFATQAQPDFLAGREELAFVILTSQRPLLFEKTMRSFYACCEDIQRVTKWIAVDHGSAEGARKYLRESWPAFQWVYIDAAEPYYKARQAFLQATLACYTRLALLWEDDWEMYRSGRIITQAETAMAYDQAIKSVGYRYWPDEVRSFGGLQFRVHETTQATGPSGYQDYSDSHWGPFSWNPGLHETEALRQVVIEPQREERAICRQYTQMGFLMAHTMQGYVRHIGEESRIGNNR